MPIGIESLAVTFALAGLALGIAYAGLDRRMRRRNRAGR